MHLANNGSRYGHLQSKSGLTFNPGPSGQLKKVWRSSEEGTSVSFPLVSGAVDG